MAHQTSHFVLPNLLKYSIALISAVLAFSLQAQEAAAPSSLREADGLKLNCPVALTENAPAKANPLAITETRFKAVSDGVELSITSINYKDDVTLDLDKMAEGSAAGISKLDGISNPISNVTPLTLEGADGARRLSYKANRRGKVLRNEACYIQKGQHIWIVMTIFEGGNNRTAFVGETIIKSVRLK